MASGDEEFLSRWSRLKREEAAKSAPEAASATPAAVPAPGESAQALPAVELPPIDSLTIESDYRGFLQPGVGPALRKAALAKLFSDPHFRFEQMDKLDTYIDDYSIEDPISDEMMKTLDHARHILFDEKPKSETAAAVADGDQLAAGRLPPAAAEAQSTNDDPRKDS